MTSKVPDRLEDIEMMHSLAHRKPDDSCHICWLMSALKDERKNNSDLIDAVDEAIMDREYYEAKLNGIWKVHEPDCAIAINARHGCTCGAAVKRKDFLERVLFIESLIEEMVRPENKLWTSNNCPLLGFRHAERARLLTGVGCSTWSCPFCGKEFQE